jgi:Flp pilus assembly protein TadD
VLNGLGEVSLATGQPDPARTHHDLGLAHQATGDSGQARRHWQQALTLYTSLGTPRPRTYVPGSGP